MITRVSITVAAIALAAVCLPSLAQYSVPPATYRPKVTATDVVKPALLLANDAPARIVKLASPTAAEREQLAAKAVSAHGKSTVMKNRRMQIGYARELPPQSRSI